MYFQFFCPDELNSPRWITILRSPVMLTTPKTPEEKKKHLCLHLIYARLISVIEGREHASFYVLLNYFLSLHIGIMWQDFRAAAKKGDQKLPCVRLQPAPGWPAAAGQRWAMNDSASIFWRSDLRKGITTEQQQLGERSEKWKRYSPAVGVETEDQQTVGSPLKTSLRWTTSCGRNIILEQGKRMKIKEWQMRKHYGHSANPIPTPLWYGRERSVNWGKGSFFSFYCSILFLIGKKVD